MPFAQCLRMHLLRLVQDSSARVATPLAHKFSNNQCEAEASDTEHQWACKDVLETIEAVPYHEVFIHSFGDYDTRGL